MTDTIDSKVRELLEKVKTRKKAVQKAESNANKRWKTTGSFPPVLAVAVNINIQTAKEADLLNVIAQIRFHQDYVDRAAKELELPIIDTYAGFPYADWVEDCHTRLAKIQLSGEKTKLSDLEKRLDSIISPEQRRQIELEAIINELDD